LFQREQHAADWGTEGNAYSRSRCSGENFAFFGFILPVCGEEFEVEVCTAAGDVDQGTFLA